MSLLFAQKQKISKRRSFVKKEKRVMCSNRTDPFLYSVFYGVKKKLLMAFYALSVLALGTTSIIVIGYLTDVTGKIQLLLILLIAIAGITGGAFLFVLLDLSNIGCKFDEIKNDIASKTIKTTEEFANRVCTFICNYFNFSFFTIAYCFFNIIDSDYVCSDNIIRNNITELKFTSMLNKSQQTEKVTYIGKHSVGDKNYHLYIIPIWFGKEWLGYIGIFSPNKLWNMFILFLSDFENEYVDDQLVHVLNMKNAAAIQK